MVQEMRQAQRDWRVQPRNDICRKRTRTAEAEVDAFLGKHLKSGDEGSFKGKVNDLRKLQKLFFSRLRTDAVKKLLGAVEREIDKEIEAYMATLEQPKLF